MDKATTGNINVIKAVDRGTSETRNGFTIEHGIDDWIDKSNLLMTPSREVCGGGLCAQVLNLTNKK